MDIQHASRWIPASIHRETVPFLDDSRIRIGGCPQKTVAYSEGKTNPLNTSSVRQPPHYFQFSASPLRWISFFLIGQHSAGIYPGLWVKMAGVELFPRLRGQCQQWVPLAGGLCGWEPQGVQNWWVCEDYRAFLGILSEFIGEFIVNSRDIFWYNNSGRWLSGGEWREWLGAVDINICPLKNGDPRSNLVEDNKPLPIGLARWFGPTVATASTRKIWGLSGGHFLQVCNGLYVVIRILMANFLPTASTASQAKSFSLSASPQLGFLWGAIDNPLVVLYDRFLMDEQNRSYLINLINLINLSIYPSINLSVHPSFHPSIHPSIYLSIHLYILYYIYYICMYVWNRNQNSRSIWLSLNLTLSYSIIYIYINNLI